MQDLIITKKKAFVRQNLELLNQLTTLQFILGCRLQVIPLAIRCNMATRSE